MPVGGPVGSCCEASWGEKLGPWGSCTSGKQHGGLLGALGPGYLGSRPSPPFQARASAVPLCLSFFIYKMGLLRTPTS